MESVISLNSCHIKPDKLKKEQIIYLTKSQSAWISITWLSEELLDYSRKNYEQLFALHPQERGKVVLYGDEIASQRWHKSYLNTPLLSQAHHNKSYMFAGKENYKFTPLPALLQVYLDELNKTESKDKYNQAIVNWYANGNDYIAAHSDCQLFMKPQASIAILSLYENENDFRELIFKPKKTTDFENDFIYPEFKIAALQGSIINMHGDLQQKFRHKIPKAPCILTSRISVTFRKF